MMCISQSPFRRVSPFLLALFLVASFWVAGPALANSEGFYSSEADFLSKADTGWVKIAEGVYEKAMPNGETIRHGFGLKANQFFLESAMAKKEALLQRRSATDETSFAKMLSEIDHTINGLKASLARAAERPPVETFPRPPASVRGSASAPSPLALHPAASPSPASSSPTLAPVIRPTPW